MLREQIRSPSRRKVHSWQQAPAVYRRQLVASFAFTLAANTLAGDFVEVVVMVFAGARNQHVFFFPDHVLAHVFGHFKIGSQLDGMSRAGFFAETAHDAAREIDTEKLGI